jgi:hypothetical protein
MRTNDGGNTWNYFGMGETHLAYIVDRRNIHFAHGEMYLSHDLGSTWEFVPKTGGGSINGLFFFDSSRGWAVGGVQNRWDVWKYHPTNTGTTHPAHPEDLSLSQCYPNPVESAASQSVISYGIPEYGNINLALYDLLGREVQVLASGLKAPGTYTVTLNATALPPGMYVYRLETGSGFISRKMVLMK